MTLLRTDSFVPLTAVPAADERRDFRVSVIPQNSQARPFQTLESSAPAPAGLAPGKNCEPRLSVQRDGDRITGIRIQCTCGQVLDVACLYEPPAKSA